MFGAGLDVCGQRDGDAAHFRTAGRIIRVPERIVFCLGAVSDAAGGDGHDFTEIWFLRHFSFETGTAIGGKYVWMQVVISAIIIGLELYADLSKAIVNARNFNILVCVSLWFINLMAYYQFYTIDQGTKKIWS